VRGFGSGGMIYECMLLVLCVLCRIFAWCEHKCDFVSELWTGVCSFLVVSRRIRIVLVSARRLSTFLASEGRFGARGSVSTLFILRACIVQCFSSCCGECKTYEVPGVPPKESTCCICMLSGRMYDRTTYVAV